MIIVVAALEFGSEKDRDEAVVLTADVQRLTREEEPGCHDYCFAPDPAIPTRMQVYELWADSESLAAHFQHPYYERMAGLLQGVGIVRRKPPFFRIEPQCPTGRGGPLQLSRRDWTRLGQTRPACVTLRKQHRYG